MKACALALLFSLCGISYQFLLVRAITPFFHDEVLCQCVTLGTFLLGMGLGAAFCAWVPATNPLSRLFRVEIALAILGALLVPAAMLGLTAFELVSDAGPLRDLGPQQSKLVALVLLQPLSLLAGALTGAELPLLSLWLERDRGPDAATRVLAFSYFGAILGAALVSFLLVPHLTLTQGGLAVSFLNLAGACSIAPRSLSALLAAISVLVTHFVVAREERPLSQALLKTVYLELRLPRFSFASLRDWHHSLAGFADVERRQTAYQTIDLIPDHFLLSDPTRGDFALYLNQQPQFSRDSVAGYHESMVFGSIALAARPLRHALVLGGGDGLLARELLRAGVESVTLVELDPAMTELATSQPDLLSLNGGALLDPRVHVITGDAFAYARTTNAELFDGAFLDFPFPTSYDVLKLYSEEFYRALRGRLEPGGFFVFDAPLWSDPRLLSQFPRPFPQDVILSTIHAAGWVHALPFGPTEPFLFVTDAAEAPEFHYDRLPCGLSGKTLFNLTPTAWAFRAAPTDPNLVNSVLRPRRIRW